MSLKAAVGQSWEMAGDRAGYQAARQAVENLGRAPISLGLVIASTVFPIEGVLSGVFEATGEIPLIGFSTPAEISALGRCQKSVVVGLLSGEALSARVGWWPDLIHNCRGCVARMFEELQPDDEARVLLVIGDGMGADSANLLEELGRSSLPIAGCLSGSDPFFGRTYQFGGRRSGSGGLAAAVLNGSASVGIGAAHGWQPIGALTRVSRVQGPWVRTLDDQPPNEIYSQYFGQKARNWVYQPLNHLVRLYPLRSNEGGRDAIHAPIRMEADGSLRMNTTIREGAVVDFMVGTQEACREAASMAANQALTAIKGGKPRLALLLVDTAWQSLLTLHPRWEAEIVRSVIGEDVPLIGAYSLGQVFRPSAESLPELLNQHIEVLLFG
jgi:hypothetical protein